MPTLASHVTSFISIGMDKKMDKKWIKKMKSEVFDYHKPK